MIKKGGGLLKFGWVVLFLSGFVWGNEKPVFDFKKLPSDSELLKNYYNKFSQMQSNVCKKGDDLKYDQLLKSFRQEGYYLPFLTEDQIDLEAIQQNLALIQAKNRWLLSEIKKLEKSKLPQYSALTKNVQSRVKSLLDLKKKHRLAKKKPQKDKLLLQSRKEVQALNRDFKVLFGKISFLLNAHFPVDHQKNRAEFDHLKAQEGEEFKKKSNHVFFQRKIFEDGTFDSNHARSDIFLRTTLDTLALNLLNEKDFLSENTRFDIEWTLNQLRIAIGRGKKDHQDRLKRWQKRTAETLAFYEGLLHPETESLKHVTQSRVKAAEEIKEFVHEKIKNVYSFWVKEDEIYQALFISELILLHEVGRPLKENELDRRDVLQIVLNRKNTQKYSRMIASDRLMRFLKKLFTSEKNRSQWLDVLFKEGEFSFTYYFIPAVKNIFCPEMSPHHQKQKEINLKLALEQFKNPQWDFKALRYFSRISMIGKVDMDPLWRPDYIPIAERVGKKVLLNKNLKTSFDKGFYQYFYSFVDPEGVNFDVIRLKGVTYSVKNLEKKTEFYSYRDPQYFRYFMPAPQKTSSP